MQQQNKIDSIIKNAPQDCNGNYYTPEEVYNDNKISRTNKTIAIVCAIINGSMNLEAVKSFLQAFSDKKTTDYRKILCAYDIKRYS